MGKNEDNEEPLVDNVFVNERPRRDICWTIFYSILVILCSGIAFFAALSRNDEYKQIFTKEYYKNPDYCTPETAPAGGVPGGGAAPGGGPQRLAAVTLFEMNSLDTDKNLINDNIEIMKNDITDKQDFETAFGIFNSNPVNSARNLLQDPSKAVQVAQNKQNFLTFLDDAAVWIVISTLCAVFVGFIFVMMFSQFAKFMVYFTVTFIVFIPVVIGLVCVFSYNQKYIGYTLVGIGVILIIPVLCFRVQLNLAGNLLDVGADGIRDNFGIAAFALCTNLVLLLVITLFILFGVVSLTNGTFNKVYQTFDQVTGCKDSISRTVQCCDWDVHEWVVWYWVFIVVMILLHVSLIGEIRVYVTASVVSQWYFKQEGQIKEATGIMQGLKNAVGPSFGSLVISSMILTVADIIRATANRLTKQASEDGGQLNCCFAMINCIIQAIASLLEWITEFATIRIAITGESFLTAGKNVVLMLKRNFLNAYTVWWVLPIVLSFSASLLSASVSAIIALAAYAFWVQDPVRYPDPRAWSIYLFFVCLFLVVIVLYFFSKILIDAVNTIFVCYAMDKDSKREISGKVNDVFSAMIVGDPNDTVSSSQVRSRGMNPPMTPTQPAPSTIRDLKEDEDIFAPALETKGISSEASLPVV